MMTAAIILAAGESSRMGSPKALLSWGEATLIEYQVRELAAAGVDDIVVVIGHEANEVGPRVPSGARIIVNEAYQEGRASSLRAGAAALPDGADPILVLNVDQPRPRDVHEALLTAHRNVGALITQPVVDGRRGHPPVLSGALLAELRAAAEESEGLRGVIAAHAEEVRDAEMPSQIVLLGFNTPAEYRAALMRFESPLSSSH